MRGIAGRQLAAETGDASLQVSDLAHETLLRLLAQRRARFRDRRHLFAVAARMVRRILVDRARQRRTRKHGGDLQRVGFDSLAARTPEVHPDLLALDAALEELASIDAQSLRIVELRYFAGLSIEETAAVLGIGRSSVIRCWR